MLGFHYLLYPTNYNTIMWGRWHKYSQFLMSLVEGEPMTWSHRVGTLTSWYVLKKEQENYTVPDLISLINWRKHSSKNLSVPYTMERSILLFVNVQRVLCVHVAFYVMRSWTPAEFTATKPPWQNDTFVTRKIHFSCFESLNTSYLY